MQALDFNRLDQRMRNWGTWASGDGAGRGVCASAEHHYVPPKLGEGEEAVHRTPMSVDVVDAERIERAVCRILVLPVRRFLVDNYVRRYNRARLCERARVDLQLLEAFHLRALTMVADSLASQEVQLVRRGKALWAGVARITSHGV